MTRTLSDPPDPHNPEIEYSSLCREEWAGERMVWVKIYRLAGTGGPWLLEVEATDGSSTVWDDPFDTEAEALAEFEATAARHGLDQFYDDGDSDPALSVH